MCHVHYYRFNLVTERIVSKLFTYDQLTMDQKYAMKGLFELTEIRSVDKINLLILLYYVLIVWFVWFVWMVGAAC